MSVHLRYRENKTGKTSIYLDIHSHGKRERKRLEKLFLYKNPKTQDQRRHNNEVRTLAEKRRSEEQSNRMYEAQDMISPIKQESFFINYFKEFQANYTRKDIKKVDAAVDHFETFSNKRKFRFLDMNENIVSDYKKYLEDKKLAGHTVKAYFNKFRQVMRRAFNDHFCRYDIRTFETRFKLDSGNLKKETLTPEEIQKIADTECSNNTIKLAFIFCCFTGLDFADVFELKWIHISESGLRKPREKTKVGRVLPLHETALAILSWMYPTTEYVFQELPNRKNRTHSWQACNKAIGLLVRKAGINKHVTWHVGRHSFGTNTEGDDRTIAQLLGHSNAQMVQVYRRAKQDRMKKAVDSLKGVKLS